MTLAILFGLAIPPVLLQVACAGKTCSAESVVAPPAPFCSLPSHTQRLIQAGFYDGRSPDVMAVAASGVDITMNARRTQAWPSVDADIAVPLAFLGDRVARRTVIPDRTGLEDAAPTIAAAIDLRRAHPNVRDGKPIPGLMEPGVPPRLVLLVAWEGVGSADLRRHMQAWSHLRNLMKRGSGTLRAVTGSLPIDPAAILTTIGTGGLPAQHGVTGRTIASEKGQAVVAWSARSPGSVIATLADDLDHGMDERPVVGMVGAAGSDRGLIGNGWYGRQDTDRFRVAPDPGDATELASRMLRRGFGLDAVPDLLGVALAGPTRKLDQATSEIILNAEEAAGGSLLVVVAGTGAARTIPSADNEPRVDLSSLPMAGGEPSAVDAVTAGGVFLSDRAMRSLGITSADVRTSIAGVVTETGEPVMADVFPSYAVSFGKWC